MIYVDPTAPVATQKRSLFSAMEPFQQMVQSEGWRLLEQHLLSEEAAILADAEKATTGEAALRCTTALSILRRLRMYPAQVINYAQRSLEQLDSSEEAL